MESNMDYSNISIGVLNKSKKILAEALNIPRACLNDEGVQKDWRGLLHYVGGDIGSMSSIDLNPTEKVLEIWQLSKEFGETYNVKCLLNYLKQLDRWDIFDDIQEFIDEDIRLYDEKKSIPQNELYNNDTYIEEDPSTLVLSQEHYDAFVLYHEKNEREGVKLVQELEQRNIRCCTVERDLLSSQFQHDAITTLISKRCSKLVILVTESFLKSGLFTYIEKYTQALGIERGNNKLVPLRFENCPIPERLKFYYMIDFTKEARTINDYNLRLARVCKSIKPDYQIKNTQVAVSTTTDAITQNVTISEIVDNRIVEENRSRPLLNYAGLQQSEEIITSTSLISNTINDKENIDIENIESQKKSEEIKTVKDKRNQKKSFLKKIKKTFLKKKERVALMEEI